MKKIKLNKGQFALVDDEDFEWLNQWTWYYGTYKRTRTGYAERHDNTAKKRIKMHRLILNAPNGIKVDHKDHNGLNNCRSNLRLATNSQNGANRRKQTKVATSKFKGVSWHRKLQKWRAAITINQQRFHIGVFVNEIDAAMAYDAKALKLFGEYACLNFADKNTLKIIGNVHEGVKTE